MRPLRILLCNDAHYLNTGFAKFGLRLLQLLSNHPKFIVGELACNGTVNHPQRKNYSWYYYANCPDRNSPDYPIYKSDVSNEYGGWRWEKTLLHFRPDVCLSFLDPWMCTHIYMSPLRRYYSWIYMPTIDSLPIQGNWLEIYHDADVLLAYTDYGKQSLEKYGLKVDGIIPWCPPADYSPVKDQLTHKNIAGLPTDAIIIGTVMRNQVRKLYPDLLAAFRKYLDICKENGNEFLLQNSYLYLHCGHPDVGWDIPLLISQYELGNKCYLTYVCSSCKNYFCSIYRGVKSVCPTCLNYSAILSNAAAGITDQQLSQIINCFDLYVQYSTSEGFGMPQIEAGLCGVKVASVDFSAMHDVCSNIGGLLIPVERYFQDYSTDTVRALPDINKTAELFYEYCNLPYPIRSIEGNNTYKLAQKYDWDKNDVFQSLVKILEDMPYKDWNKSSEFVWDNLPEELPDPLRAISNYEYVKWVVLNVLQEPRLLDSYTFYKYVHFLDAGMKYSKNNVSTFNRDKMYDECRSFAKNKALYEKIRTDLLKMQEDQFIQQSAPLAKDNNV